jgi:hypothetical protein
MAINEWPKTRGREKELIKFGASIIRCRTSGRILRTGVAGKSAVDLGAR